MNHKLRNVLFILAGALVHILSGSYFGPFEEWVRSYGSNLAVSFALFFLLQFLRLPGIGNPLACAGYALAILFVEEFAQRSSQYAGVFDPWDFLYDAIGVFAAVGLNKIAPASRHEKKDATLANSGSQ